MYCDNQSALALVHNPVLKGRCKHMDLRMHFIRRYIQNGDIDAKYVSTENQLADFLTKPLSPVTFMKFVRYLLREA